MQSEKCAAITMVWKSYPFLSKWIEYYSTQFGRENLFILAHGEDEKIREICKGANLWTLPREFTVDFDPIRWRALSEMTSALTKFYKAVICSDCDELVILDPKHQTSLTDYLLAQPNKETIRATGFNLLPIKNNKTIKTLDWSAPLLQQMNMVSGSLEYSKACIAYGDVDFHPGGHTLSSGTTRLSPDLLLFHLKYIDLEEWKKIAGDLKTDINTDIKRGGDKHKIGTHWRKGARVTSALAKSMIKGETVTGDYIAYVHDLVSQAEYNSEWRRRFRKNPTKGELDDRFTGAF